MKKLMHGKIFAMPLSEGKYLCGRVMLDIGGNIKRRVLAHDSPLVGLLAGSFLIEMYSAISSSPEYVPSSTLISGAFVDPKEIGKAWPIVGEREVDPRSVEFPESLSGWTHFKGDAAFYCGEMRIPVPFSEKKWLKDIGVLGGFDFAPSWRFVCLWALGIPNEYKFAASEFHDLRFSRHRPCVYEHLPFPMEMSYFEKQAQLGLHFERLYE